MKTYLLFIFILIFTSTSIQGQKKEVKKNKNEFSILIGTAFTKTNIDLEKNSPFFIDQERDPLSKAVWGNDIGIEYTRYLNSKFALSVGLRHTQKGQQSKNRFFSRSPTIDSVDILRTAGGFSGKLLLESDEIFLLFKRNLFQNKDIKANISFGTSIDYINKMRFVRYSIELEEGTKERGCCSRTYLNINENYINQIGFSIKKNYFRLGALVNGELSYKLSKSINSLFRIEGQLLTGFIFKDAYIKSNFLPTGTIALIRFQTGLTYNF